VSTNRKYDVLALHPIFDSAGGGLCRNSTLYSWDMSKLMQWARILRGIQLMPLCAEHGWGGAVEGGRLLSTHMSKVSEAQVCATYEFQDILPIVRMISLSNPDPVL
jgi:hypothetical protein